jgi:hypothetical protein
MEQRPSGSELMNSLPARMNQEAGFPASVLSDSQGLTIVFAAPLGAENPRGDADRSGRRP